MKKYALLAVLVTALIFSGCDKRSSYALGCEAYDAGDYVTAEDYFLDTLAGDEVLAVHYLAYAYNLVQLSDYTGAQGVIGTLLEDESLEKTLTQKERKEAYYLLAYTSQQLDEYVQAIEYYTEMRLYETDGTVRGNIDATVFSLYRRYFDALIIDESTDVTVLLSCYDEIKAFTSLHTELLDGGTYTVLAGMSLYLCDLLMEDESYDYLSLLEQAQLYIEAAKGLDGADEKLLERYGVVIAERRGKTEVAYKLLEVYAAHYPDDESAVLEAEFLRDRLLLE